MADPLLTTLCSICHAAPPKYVCPGCAAATCSLACSQRHKAWASCSGRRDPTAYMPPSRLKTAAGIDHDYNFLSAIERERDRNQRELVEDRGMFTERQLRELDEPRRWRRMWFGEEVRFVNREDERRRGGGKGGERGATGGMFASDGEGDGDEEEEKKNNGSKTSSLVRKVRKRLDQADIEVVHMPTGMTRQRENTTAWNRRAACINWCVEWLLYDDLAPGGGGAAATRIRHKALETTPLYRALGSSLAWYRHGQQQHKSKQHDDSSDDDEVQLSAHARKRRRVLIKEVKEAGRRTAPQDAEAGGTWLATPYAAQNPYTGAWDVDRAAAVSSWLPDEEIAAQRGHRFFLLRPLTPAGKPRELIPVPSDETLAQTLAGRTVLEFPTVYVLPPPGEGEAEDSLPEGCVLCPTELRRRQRKAKPEKRKAGARANHPAKRQALDGVEGAEIPIRAGSRHRQQQQQRGRGRGGARGRGGRGGGRFQQQQRTDPDAEEGEINSDGNEVGGPVSTASGRGKVVVADTSSSDLDTSSDEEEAAVGENKGNVRGDDSGGAMDVDGGFAPGLLKLIQTTKTSTPATTPSNSAAAAAAARAAGNTKATGFGSGLVDYGSDSSDDDDDADDDDNLGDADLAGLRPENPELVASAIQEIVGLLT